MDPNITPEHFQIPKYLANSKRPKNKRKDKDTNSSTKPKYYPPRQEYTKQGSSKDQVISKPSHIKPDAKKQTKATNNLQSTNITPQNRPPRI